MGDAQAHATDAGHVLRSRFADIYATYCPYVWRCVRRMGTVPEQVEDVVQDVFLVISERLHLFEGRASLKTWIYAITFRVAAEHRRRRNRNERSKVLAWDPSSPASADEEVLARQLADRLHALLDTLDLDQRAVFVLAELEQMSGPEIAEILGIKLNTVYSRLRLARRRLDRELAAGRGRTMP
jgi:RNA polymerase sigma-70 factor (ECF subfamily)